MNDATKMAVALARKGASDDVIALVMETMAPRATAPALVLESPQAAAPARSHTCESRYRPLLDAIRKQVAASGPVEATARELCERHKEEWAMSRTGRSGNDNARGFAAVLANAVKGTVTGVGFMHGARITFLRRRPASSGNGGGADVAVYRIELA